MKENQFITPETGKLLEEAGLFTLDTVENWHVNGVGLDKVLPKEVCKLSNLEYRGVFLTVAPTLGEIWELLPEFLYLRNEDYIPLNLELLKYVIGYYDPNCTASSTYTNTLNRELHSSFVYCIPFDNNNPADAAGRLLLQLHRDGKLDKKGETK